MTSKNPLDDPVFKDHRGEIRRYEMDGVKFNALFTKAGVMRSGDYHPNKQFDLVLSGELEITMKKGDKEEVVTLGPNELIEIPPNVPHLFRFKKDTVMMEWWDGPFECKYYEPYRKLIEEESKKE